MSYHLPPGAYAQPGASAVTPDDIAAMRAEIVKLAETIKLLTARVARLEREHV